MSTRSAAPAPRRSILLWFFSSPAAIYYAITASFLCLPLAARGVITPATNWVVDLAQGAAVTRWVLNEARRARREVSFDFPAFCLFTWPVFAPVFAFRTRGWRAFAVLGWFALIVVASAVTASGLMSLLQRG